MFVAPQSSSDKWYGLGFESELLCPLHATYRNNCVITNNEKKKHRLGKPEKQFFLNI